MYQLLLCENFLAFHVLENVNLSNVQEWLSVQIIVITKKILPRNLHHDTAT